MSGEDLPYQLRPNKFIDRELFMDLLAQFLPERGANKYVYVSMGGKHLIDHRAIYRRVGVTNLFSFDLNAEVVARQNFNRPIDKAICNALKSSSLAGTLDTILQSFEGTSNLVVWLDYTSPHDRLSQFQELVEVATRLEPGDIIRITLNASTRTLEDESYSSWREHGFFSPAAYRASRLRYQIGDYMPATLDAIGEDEFSSALCECLALAFSKAEGERKDIRFSPVLLTTYRDGQRMVTATCIVESASATTPSTPKNWLFAPNGWTDLTKISAPDLSVREKLKIDENLSKNPNDIIDQLGFLPAKTREKSLDAIQSYQRLHRYYPAFHNIDA